MIVMAVTCDGKPECFGSVDEKDCKQNNVYNILGKDHEFLFIYFLGDMND